MTETEVSINVSFQPSQGTWTALTAAGIAMVAGILIAVTLGVGWMSASFEGESLTYALSELKADNGESIGYGELADLSEGELGGSGMIAAGKAMAITGTVFAFVSMLVLAVSLFVRNARLTLIGSCLFGLTTLFLMLAVIFAPIGISTFHDDITAGNGANISLDWGAGLILGVIATVFALGGTTAGFLALRDPNVS